MYRPADSTLSRRSFLAISGAALGFAGLARAADDAYGGFRMGVQTYSFRNFSFADALVKTRELGLSHVELYPGHLDHASVTPAQLAEAKQRMADAGITADAYGVVPFSQDEAAARKIFDFAKEVGILSISADPAADSFELLDRLLEEYKIPVAIHNHGPHHQWGDPNVIHAAIKDHHPLIGLCADTGHFLRAGVDPIEALRILRGRFFGMHVKDFVGEETETIIGEGNLDLKGLIAEMQAQAYAGPCALEYELSPEDPMAGMRQGLANFRAAVAALG
jgi:inosose dehydratase